MSAMPEPAGAEEYYRVGLVAWPRPAEVLFAGFDRVAERAAASTRAQGGRRRDLAADELALVGAWSAGAWTLGQNSKAPMSRAERPLTWEMVWLESDTALSISTVQLVGWEYAIGVNRWMRWIQGEVPQLWLPGDPRPQGWPSHFR